MVFFIIWNNINRSQYQLQYIYCNNPIFKFPEMTDYPSYSQFLNASYRKILEACLQDEAIETLKILQNKDYLLLRINELFSEIYVAERENKIQEQAKTIDSLRQKQTTNVLLGKTQRCLQCDSLRQEITRIEHEKKEILKKLSDATAEDQRQNKKIERLLLKQNEDMKKQLKRLREQLTQQKEQYQHERQFTQDQKYRISSKLKDEGQKYDQNLRILRNVITKHQTQKENLQLTVFEFMESKGREEKQGRQNLTKLNNAILIRQKQQAELTMIKSQNNVLEEKIIRLEEENQYLKEKQADYEKNMKKLKAHTDQLEKQSHTTAIHHNIEKDNKGQEGQWEIDMFAKLSQAQKKLLQTQKQNNGLKVELSAKQKQFSEINMHQQKHILTLSQELKKCQLKHERQVKTIKEDYKKLLLKSSQQTVQTKEQQQEETVKKYEAIISQKQRIIAKKEEQFTVLNRTLAQTQRNLQDTCHFYEQQKAIIVRQLEEQKQRYKDIKKHYSLEKTSDQSLQNQYKEKVSEVVAQKQEIHRLVLMKQKQIKEYKKELLKASEKTMNAQLRYQQYKNKYQRSVQTVDQYIKQVNQLKDSLKDKDREAKQLAIKNASLSEQKDQIQKKQMCSIKNEKRLEQKIKRLELDLNQKRDILLQIHKDNKDDVIDVFDKVQQTTSQTRKQLEQYYTNLLQSNQEKKSNQQLHHFQRIKNEQMRVLKSKSEQSEQHLSKYRQKYADEVNQNQNYQHKIHDLSLQIDQLKEQNNRAFDLVRQEKNKHISMVKTYQQKMQQYYNNFQQFKREFYLNIREELQKLKHQLRAIAQYMGTQASGLNDQLAEISLRVSRESELMNTHYHLKTQKIRHQYDYGVVSRLQEEKREIQLTLQMKLKEQSMEFFTIMAEKEHQIASLEEKQAKQSKRISQAESKFDDVSKIAKQATKKQEELKEIISKMNQKVSEAERTSSNAHGELQYYKSENIQLKKEINSLETSFKQKIQKCREKYSAQNERLFARYEKQFSKFIVSNKKSLQFSMLSNSCSNLHIPTKGVSNDDRLQTIQRQIEQQKKKLNLLEKGGESKAKFEKTSKIMGYGAKLEKQRRS